MSIAQHKELATGLNFPEGPVFDKDGNIWIVELKAGNLIKISGGNVERFATEGTPNGATIDKAGNVWFCDASQKSIRVYDPVTKIFTTKASHVDGEELNKPNDLAFDLRGNVVFSCPGESRKEPTGYACVITKDGKVKKVTDQKYFPNGVAFTNDGKKLVIAETYKHRLWIGDWNADKAEWTNSKVYCEVGGPDGPGGPDGMAFDSDGNLYVAVYGTGEVRIVDKQGKMSSVLTLPGKNPTNCAFDPSGKLGLVVTETEKGTLLSIPLKANVGNMFKQ